MRPSEKSYAAVVCLSAIFGVVAHSSQFQT